MRFFDRRALRLAEDVCPRNHEKVVGGSLLVAFLLHSAAGQLPPAPEAVFPWAALQDARIIEYNQRICFTYPRIWQPAVGEQKAHRRRAARTTGTGGSAS